MRFIKDDRHDLYQEDIRPFQPEEKNMSPLTLGITWFGISVQLGIFLLCGQLAGSLTLWQIALALVAGLVLCWGIAILVGEVGIKFGLPYVANGRAAFGYKGVHLIGLCKFVPSVFWAGMNIWMCGQALSEVLLLTIGVHNLPICMAVCAVVMVVLVFHGAKFVSLFNYFVSPMLLIIGIYMLYLLLSSNQTSLSQVLTMGSPGGSFSGFVFAAMGITGGWIMVVAGINDITRECTAPGDTNQSWWHINGKFSVAQFLGLVPGTLLFGMIGAISMVLTGTGNPVEAITAIVAKSSVTAAVICQVFVLLALLSTNSGANILGAAYIVCNTFKKVNLKTAAVGVAALALVIQPWNATSMLETFMNILGNMMAPVAGILITDYYLIRKRQLDLDQLYCSSGKYRYWKGINPAAMIAYGVSILISLLAWNYMILIAVFASGIIYYFLMKKWILKRYPGNAEIPIGEENVL